MTFDNWTYDGGLASVPGEAININGERTASIGSAVGASPASHTTEFDPDPDPRNSGF